MFDRVVEMISAQLPVKGKTITADTRLIEDLGADSANIMILVMDLENEFDIIVEDDVLTEIHTVGDIVNYLEEHAKK